MLISLFLDTSKFCIAFEFRHTSTTYDVSGR